MLIMFLGFGTVTLLSIVLGSNSQEIPEVGARRPYAPEDFPGIQWDEPLLPSVTMARDRREPTVYDVPSPPFSEDIFPCSECHADLETDPERRRLEMFHEEVELDHGPTDRWCFDCHDQDDRDRLRLANGRVVGFDESFVLCGQCHGTIYRDWREGIHGRRRGYWNGSKSYLLCAHCHDPHAPGFAPMEPLPPPVRPEFLRRNEE